MANNKKQNTKETAKKKNNYVLLVVAAVAVICLAVLLLVDHLGTEQPEETAGTTVPATTAVATQSNDSQQADESGVQKIGPGESLVIPVSEVTTTASFYPIEVDGTQMEVLAVRDSEGNIRTAFNTCQVCYSSGRGYYVQDGEYLVCQNCWNHFSVDQVEVQTGGCNPWPIFPENKTVTEDSIIISYDFLSEQTRIFANWKANG